MGRCLVLHNTFSPSRCGGLCGAIGPSGYRSKNRYTLARLYSDSLSSSGAEFIGGRLAAEHRAGVMVYPVLYLGGLLLRHLGHALTFGQFTAYQLVCDLVRAALMRGLRMAVERSHAESIYTGLVGKFRAIVAGQRLEDHVPIAGQSRV